LLAPGEGRRVSFKITVNDLTFWRAECLAEPELIWEPGEFLIQLGGCSDDLLTAAVEWRR
jgi:hypothetical protein